MSKKSSVLLPLKKETDNTYQYQLPKGEREGVCVSTIYIRKETFGGVIPAQVLVTVEEA